MQVIDRSCNTCSGDHLRLFKVVTQDKYEYFFYFGEIYQIHHLSESSHSIDLKVFSNSVS